VSSVVAIPGAYRYRPVGAVASVRGTDVRQPPAVVLCCRSVEQCSADWMRVDACSTVVSHMEG